MTGMLRMPNHVRQAYGPDWALVGDAGYHRDAITGHGMSDAYRDAELLAVALDDVLRGDAGERSALAGYQARRDRALLEVFDITRAMSAYPSVPELVELQKQLGRAMDTEAHELAGWPVPLHFTGTSRRRDHRRGRGADGPRRQAGHDARHPRRPWRRRGGPRRHRRLLHRPPF